MRAFSEWTFGRSFGFFAALRSQTSTFHIFSLSHALGRTNVTRRLRAWTLEKPDHLGLHPGMGTDSVVVGKLVYLSGPQFLHLYMGLMTTYPHWVTGRIK